MQSDGRSRQGGYGETLGFVRRAGSSRCSFVYNSRGGEVRSTSDQDRTELVVRSSEIWERATDSSFGYRAASTVVLECDRIARTERTKALSSDLDAEVAQGSSVPGAGIRQSTSVIDRENANRWCVSFCRASGRSNRCQQERSDRHSRVDRSPFAAHRTGFRWDCRPIFSVCTPPPTWNRSDSRQTYERAKGNFTRPSDQVRATGLFTERVSQRRRLPNGSVRAIPSRNWLKNMAGKRRKSKKQSGANSRSTRPHDEKYEFFVDECVSPKHVPNMLREAGHKVQVQGPDTFGTGRPDADWLPLVGERKWVLVTKDKNIRKRRIEQQALKQAGVRAFVLTGHTLTGEEQVQVLKEALPAMIRLLWKQRRSAYFIARVTAKSNVQLIEPTSQLRT